MTSNPQAVLHSSTDSDEIFRAAMTLAQAPDPDGHRALLMQLQAPGIYDRLDSKEAYGDFGMPLQLSHILTALSENHAGGAHAVLVALTQSPVYNSVNRRINLLSEACAAIRPAPPEVVRYWDNNSQPLDGYTPTTIGALVVNGSPPALALLEQKMADPRHDNQYKIGWMHRKILQHRNDSPLLASSLRMLQGDMPEELRAILIETLFDYRPIEWYPGKRSTVPKPPPREQASREAIEQLRQIGEYSLNHVELTNEQRTRVLDFLQRQSVR